MRSQTAATAAPISAAKRSADARRADDIRSVTQNPPADVRDDMAHGRPEDTRQVHRGGPLGTDPWCQERSVDLQVVRGQVTQRCPDDRAEGPHGLLPRVLGGEVRQHGRSDVPAVGVLGAYRMLHLVRPPGWRSAPARTIPPRSRAPVPRPVRGSRSRGTGETVRASENSGAPFCRKAAAYAAMVEPMSPRLASITTRAPAARASSTDFSSTAMPRDPKRSKNALCGFRTATRSASASTTVRLNRSRPATSSFRPQSVSREACGSMPTHSGPRSSMARRRRAPKGSRLMRTSSRQHRQHRRGWRTDSCGDVRRGLCGGCGSRRGPRR